MEETISYPLRKFAFREHRGLVVGDPLPDAEAENRAPHHYDLMIELTDKGEQLNFDEFSVGWLCGEGPELTVVRGRFVEEPDAITRAADAALRKWASENGYELTQGR